MLLRKTLSTLALLAVLGVARAQAIDTVAPAVGSPGQVLTIDGAALLGPGGLAKPAVFLRDPSTLKKTALTVTAFSPTQLTVVFKKGLPGVRDLVVKPKGADEIVSTGAFEVKRPAFSDVDSGNVAVDHADPGAQVTANGQFFGTIKGTLLLGGRKTKIISWADNAIVFIVPVKLGSGFYSIKVQNKVGSNVVSFAIVVTNGLTLKHKIDALSAVVGKKKFTPAILPVFGLSLITTFDPNPASPAPQVPTVNILASRPGTGLDAASRTIGLNFPFDPSVDAAQPLVTNEPNGSIDYSEGGLFTTTTWDSTVNHNYSIVVLSFTDNQFVGEYSATLDYVSGPGTDPTMTVKKGKFRGTYVP